MSRKDPVELASDLGARAHDLYALGDATALAALGFVARVNPEILAWLRDRLLDLTVFDEAREHSTSTARSGQRRGAAK